MSDINSMRGGAAPPSVEGPPKWEHQNPGDEVFGEVTLAKFDIKIPGQEDGHLVEVNDHLRGPVTVWLTAAQLKTAFVDGRSPLGRRVAVGDTIYIRFDGKVPRDGGKTLNTFSINAAPGTPSNQAVPATAPMPQQPPAQQAPQGYAAPGNPGYPGTPAPQPQGYPQQQVPVQPQGYPGQPQAQQAPPQPPAGWGQQAPAAPPQQGQQGLPIDPNTGHPVPF